MKYLIILFSILTLNVNAQTLSGGHALLGEGGELPLSYYRNCMSSNLSITANRSHNAAKHFYKITGLDYYQLSAGVLDPHSFIVDSTSVSVQGSGQFSVDAEGGIFMRGNDGFWPAIRAYDDNIMLRNPAGQTWIGDDNSDGNDTYILVDDVTSRITLTNVPEFADNAAALSGGLTAGMLYRTGDTLKICH